MVVRVARVPETGRQAPAALPRLEPPARIHRLDDEEILELTYITATYEMHATMCRALRLEYDDVDERVVEIAAPAGASTDVMRMVDK